MQTKNNPRVRTHSTNTTIVHRHPRLPDHPLHERVRQEIQQSLQHVSICKNCNIEDPTRLREGERNDVLQYYIIGRKTGKKTSKKSEESAPI